MGVPPCHLDERVNVNMSPSSIYFLLFLALALIEVTPFKEIRVYYLKEFLQRINYGYPHPGHVGFFVGLRIGNNNLDDKKKQFHSKIIVEPLNVISLSK